MSVGRLALTAEAHHHAGEGDGGEHRGGDADQQHDREALDRAGAQCMNMIVPAMAWVTFASKIVRLASL
jgi:hypothetical protein